MTITYKKFWVKPETHKAIKIEASKQGITIGKYLERIANKKIDIGKKSEKDYTFP